jgi:hypothetical protein
MGGRGDFRAVRGVGVRYKDGCGMSVGELLCSSLNSTLLQTLPFQ